MKYLIVLICALVPAGWSQSTPQTMIRLAVRLKSPDVPQGSFAGEPKTMYRSGSRYCRIDEVPDMENHIHGLIIINEPDVWMINRMDKTGRHIVDQGPTFNCHLQVFADPEDLTSPEAKALGELEFGQELDYFRGKNATVSKGPVLDEKQTQVYTVTLAKGQLFLFTSGTPERPVALARQHGDKRDVYWYGLYEEVPFDPKLFSKPADIKLEEAKPN